MALLLDDLMKYKQIPVKLSSQPSVINRLGFVILCGLLALPIVLLLCEAKINL